MLQSGLNHALTVSVLATSYKHGKKSASLTQLAQYKKAEEEEEEEGFKKSSSFLFYQPKLSRINSESEQTLRSTVRRN